MGAGAVVGGLVVGCLGKRKTNQLTPVSQNIEVAPLISGGPQRTGVVTDEPGVPTVPPVHHRWRSSDNATTLLLAHAVLSYLVLRTLPVLWRPFGVSLTAWRQVLGIFLIFALAIHTIDWILFFQVKNSRQVMPIVSIPPVIESEEERDVGELTGRWIKDKQASDSMDAVCDMMKLNSLLRAAINLIKGIDIEATPGVEFRFAVLSGVLWFKIRERYPLDGTEVQHRRRDFRGGGSMGKAMPCAGGGIIIHHRFGPVMAGTMEERFFCPNHDTLNVITTLDVPSRGPPLTYTQVYRKKM